MTRADASLLQPATLPVAPLTVLFSSQHLRTHVPKQDRTLATALLDTRTPWIKPLAPPKAKATLSSTAADRMMGPEFTAYETFSPSL